MAPSPEMVPAGPDTDGTEILGQGQYVGVNVLGQSGLCRFGGTIYVG